MIRGSLPTAVAVAVLVVSTAAHRRPPQVIPPNFVGTWRLDSLLEQAEVDGPDPSDVDPAFFVLRNLQFAEDTARTEALKLKFGEGTVERVGSSLKLHATGKFAAFTIPIDPVKPIDWSTLVLRVKSSDAKELAVLTDPGLATQLEGLSQMGQGGPGPRRPPGLFPLPIPDKKADKKDEKGDGKAADAATPADGAAVPPAAGTGAPPQANPPPAPPPPAGGGAVQGGGVSMVVNVGGGNNIQIGPNGFNIDPLQLVHNAAAKLEDDGEWHTIARTRQQAGGMNSMLGMFGGFLPRQADPALKTLTLLLAVPPEKEKEGVSVEIEFIHVLDAKADYAKATVAPTTVERRSIIHQGMYLNTTSSVTWTLVAPEKGRLLAGLSCLTKTPFDVSVAVTANGKRQQLATIPIEDPDKIEPLDVDLAQFAGQQIALTIEAADHTDPAVAFLLQPLVYGKRRDDVKDVLLYFCDTLRADRLGCYGNQRPTTPNLDAIAGDGVRFERCFSQGPWTYVSMPSSLSSLFPSVDGVRTGGERIPESCTTMAEAFRNAGYLTCAMIRNDFVGPTTHTEQGFDFFYSSPAVGGGNAAAPENNNAARAALLRLAGQNADAIGGAGGGFESGSSKALFQTVEPWLAKYKDVPFFLYLHSVEPHGPYHAPKEELALFGSEEGRKKFESVDGGGMAMGPAGRPGAPNAGLIGQAPAAANVPPAPTPIPNAANYPAGTVARQFADLGIDPKEHAKLGFDLYDAAIHYMDTYVGRVVDRMKQLGFWDHMVFSFNADHGEEFFDHGNSGHGQSVYAELNHVPWILHAPGLLPKGKVVQDNAMNLDLAPTLLGLVGLAPAESMQGRSLAEALAKGEEFTPTMIVTELWGGGIGNTGVGMNFNGNFDEEVLGSFSVIEGRWKTIIRRYHKAPPAAAPANPPVGLPIPPTPAVAQPPGELVTDLEVYDLDADLTDSHSLTSEREAEAQQTLKRFLAWVDQMKEVRKRYANEKATSDDATATLRALGYAR